MDKALDWFCFPTQRVPPLVVTDLFEDIKDGVMLLALLEVLSGQKLVSLTLTWTFLWHAMMSADLFLTLHIPLSLLD